MHGFTITARPPRLRLVQGQLPANSHTFCGAVVRRSGPWLWVSTLQVQVRAWCCAVRREQRNQTTEKWIKKGEEKHLLQSVSSTSAPVWARIWESML